jgi:hypothetical protein
MGVIIQRVTECFPCLLVEATNESMADFPLLVAEEPIDRQVALTFNKKCSEQGGLHESRVNNLKKVHAFATAASGAYLGNHFGTTPHYNVAPGDMEEFSREAKNKGIPLKKYSNCENHNTDIITMVNLQDEEKGRTEFENRLMREMVDLDFAGVYQELLKKRGAKGKDGVDALRGATQQHFGYAGNHSLRRTDDGHAKPVLVNEHLTTGAVRSRFAALTRIGGLMHDNRHDVMFTGNKIKKGWKKDGLTKKRIFYDGGAHSEFSSRIHKDNSIDANTNSLSGSDDIINIHCDILNDDTPLGIDGNYHHVIVVWKCFIRDDGKVDRVAIIGYSRRSVSDAIRRKDIVDTLHE